MKTIIVTIENGNPRVETKGFVGAECLKATAELERALGVVTKDQRTPEFHARVAATERVRG